MATSRSRPEASAAALVGKEFDSVAGGGDALKRFLVEEGIGTDARFWKLAQSLSALYPPGIDE